MKTSRIAFAAAALFGSIVSAPAAQAGGQSMRCFAARDAGPLVVFKLEDNGIISDARLGTYTGRDQSQDSGLECTKLAEATSEQKKLDILSTATCAVVEDASYGDAKQRKVEIEHQALDDGEKRYVVRLLTPTRPSGARRGPLPPGMQRTHDATTLSCR